MTEQAKAPFVSRVLTGHSELGLAISALVYVLCLSGTLAVFSDELLRWERPSTAPIAPVTADLIARTFERADERAREVALERGGRKPEEILVIAPSETMPRLRAQVADDALGIHERWSVDADGRLTAQVPTPWVDLLRKIHFQLHLPGVVGLLLVGLVGLFLLAVNVSGVLAHPRIFRDAFRMRRGGNEQLQEADLHNRLGVWGLPFHLVIAFSGVALTLTVAANYVIVPAVYDGDATKGFSELYGEGVEPDDTPAPLPDLEAILLHVEQTLPDARLDKIVVQGAGTAGQLVHVTTSRPRQLNLTDRHFYDGAGRHRRTVGHDDGPIGIQWLGAITALHYGWYGGGFVKLVYGLLGAALCVVTSTGITIWVARSRSRGRRRGAWRRLWTAVVWGQPLGLAAAALCGLTGWGGWLSAAYFFLVVATLAASAAIPDEQRFSESLRALLALTLLALLLAWAIRWTDQVRDPMAWGVNATGLGLALLLLLSLPATRRAWARVRAERP